MSEVDFNQRHTMACGCEWRPGEMLCNANIGRERVHIEFREDIPARVCNQNVKCPNAAVWYCTEQASCHVRLCSEHLHQRVAHSVECCARKEQTVKKAVPQTRRSKVVHRKKTTQLAQILWDKPHDPFNRELIKGTDRQLEQMCQN